MNAELLRNVLGRLLPHVDAAQIALTGSVAISLHVAGTCEDPTRATPPQDIDFVAAGVEAVSASVTGDFLVSHFHLPHPGYPKFLIQLVDPATRLRLDFFPDTLRALSRALVVNVAGFSVRLLDAEVILDHKLQLLSGASAARPLEKKHYPDAQRLGALYRRDIPTVSPSQLTAGGYSQDVTTVCVRCEASRRADFPLASKQAVFDVLGYV